MKFCCVLFVSKHCMAGLLLYSVYLISLIILVTTASVTKGQPGKCDQTPPGVMVPTPREDKGIYDLSIQTAGSMEEKKGKQTYTPDQTYILTIASSYPNRKFKWFMITAEDPDIDYKAYDFGSKYTDVGSLTLDPDGMSRYSEKCFSSVESADNSDKSRIEVHWVSPKVSMANSRTNQKVRIRATVMENKDSWYEGEDLTIVLTKDNKKAPDSPPLEAKDKCKLCSEARYEVIFYGKWSRVAHPRHYPTKPDENGYSHMVGASHTYQYTLWSPGSKASDGLKKLAEDSNTTQMEEDIIKDMDETTGTRTLIRGKRRHHPHMSEPSHSLFRVDRHHHLFSIAVGMRPSPDWFLGTYNFDLCDDNEWLEEGSIPLYPYDAGTMDGVSYESDRSVTDPEDTIERVEVGSFNQDSPFYQMNLDDLNPYAILKVKRLDVYPLPESECSDDDEGEGEGEEQPQQPGGNAESEDDVEEPVVGELRPKLEAPERCYLSEWGAWAPCTPDDGVCGKGFRTRARYRGDRSLYFESYKPQDNVQTQPTSSHCEGDQDSQLVEHQNCFVECY